ncbi:MAG: GTPase Era, partial [Oscillospiraceae bacterium]
IAIVSDKPQTTRNKIMGVLTEGDYQYVFIDTPGMHKPKTKLSEYMVKQITDSVADVDAVIFMTDAHSKLTEIEKKLIMDIKNDNIPAILAINKIDILENKDDMLSKISAINEIYSFNEVIPISVLNDDGLDKIKLAINGMAIEGPHFFPDDTLTDQPERVIVAEIIREKILKYMRDEIPHGVAVTIEKMKDREGKNIVDIDAVIMCEKNSHKGMIIGKQGACLKNIASEARTEIESFLDTKVNLQCWVKVREDWRNQAKAIKDLGFN